MTARLVVGLNKALELWWQMDDNVNVEEVHTTKFQRFSQAMDVHIFMFDSTTLKLMQLDFHCGEKKSEPL